MILSINGWPGVGKLTVGLELAERIGARLLDNHTLINVAKALTEYGTPDYYDAIRSVRKLAFKYVLALPRDVPVVLTNVIANGGPSEFAMEHWEAILHLAVERETPLLSVTLDCDASEQARRIVSNERRALKKMLDPDDMVSLRETRSLFDAGADFRVFIDNTHLNPAECAGEIASWAKATLGLT